MDFKKLAPFLLVLGCGGDPEPGPGTDPGDGMDGGGTVIVDPPTVCDKVDLLFTVDGSGSMSEELEALRDDVFPALSASLLNIGEGLESLRVGMADACAGPGGTNLHDFSASQPCNFSTNELWMDSSSPTFTDEFLCVGDLETGCASGGKEQPASAAIAVLNDSENTGFVRDDSILVVIAVTDEDEQPQDSNRTAQEIYDDIRAIKPGTEENIVFVGVGGGQGGCNGNTQPPSPQEGAYGTAQEADLLNEVSDLFIADGRGLKWDLCAGALEDQLPQVVQTINNACENLVIID